jgi:cation:H+ antiporter
MSENLVSWLQLISGLVILIVAGEFLVRSSTKLAVYMKVSSIVIGLTIVSFGTSFPELVVSVNASLDGHPDIALGNVVGSNIANIALVLGITALIFPIAVRRSAVVVDWLLMLAITLLFIGFAWDLEIARWEGALLFTGIIVYNVWIIRASRKQQKQEIEEIETDFEKGRADLIRTLLLLLVSLVGLIFGADLLVDGAVGVAKAFNIEERIIAITVIAFGTSAPELATSLIAVYRKEVGISLGNLIGSNIFNILGILGVTSMINPIPVNPSIKSFDFILFLGIPLLLFPFLLIQLKVTRLQGFLLLSCYLTYIFLLF